MMHRATGYQGVNFTKSYISFTLTEFLTLIENAQEGTPPGTGWGVFPSAYCKQCGHEWTAVAMFNTKGKECPSCGHFDVESIWIQESNYKGEGAFLNPVGRNYTIVNKN